jgi:hypothetical protein
MFSLSRAISMEATSLAITQETPLPNMDEEDMRAMSDWELLNDPGMLSE